MEDEGKQVSQASGTSSLESVSRTMERTTSVVEALWCLVTAALTT